MLTYLAATLTPIFATLAPILAEGSKVKSGMAWLLVILGVVLGMLVTLNPVKREKEVKARKKE